MYGPADTSRNAIVPGPKSWRASLKTCAYATIFGAEKPREIGTANANTVRHHWMQSVAIVFASREWLGELRGALVVIVNTSSWATGRLSSSEPGERARSHAYTRAQKSTNFITKWTVNGQRQVCLCVCDCVSVSERVCWKALFLTAELNVFQNKLCYTVLLENTTEMTIGMPRAA